MLEKIQAVLSKWGQGLVAGVIGLLIGSFPNWYPIIQDIVKSHEPKFKVNLPVVLQGPGTGVDNIVCPDGKKGFERYSIDLTFYIEVTNNTNKSIEIFGYVFEEKVSGRWIVLQRHDCSWFIEANNKYYKAPIFNDAVISKNIDPGRTVRGWIVFSRRTNLRQKRTNWPIRLTLTDNYENKTYIKIPKAEEDKSAFDKAWMRVVPKPTWVK